MLKFSKKFRKIYFLPELDRVLQRAHICCASDSHPTADVTASVSRNGASVQNPTDARSRSRKSPFLSALLREALSRFFGQYPPSTATGPVADASTERTRAVAAVILSMADGADQITVDGPSLAGRLRSSDRFGRRRGAAATMDCGVCLLQPRTHTSAAAVWRGWRGR